MLKFKKLTMKNFMSIGACTQVINLDTDDLNIVIGENLDLGGEDSRNGVGKAQPLHSKIKTPTGWTTMGEVQIGDKISAPDGSVTTVTNLFPQGKKDIYQFTFNDGRTAEACGDHLWKVYSHVFNTKDKFKVLTTNELLDHNEKYKNHKNKSTYYMYVPLIENQETTDIDLPLDPYYLGAMLGDGHLGEIKRGFTTADKHLATMVESTMPDYLTMKKDPYNNYGYSFPLKTKTKFSPFTKDLKKLNLCGVHSDTKFIPEIYKTASLNQKLKLIQGLVDTDGYVGKQGCVSVTTVSERMAKDIQEIVWSIGAVSNISIKTNCGYKDKEGNFVKCKDAYNISIMYHTPKDLTTLPRKKDRLPGDDYQYKNRKLRIDNIEYVGEMEAQCIVVDHPDHLYITDNYVVTHNSSILNALSYVIFDAALTKIRKDNLVNKTNGKDMFVTLDFEKNGVMYRIERGRKRNITRFWVNDQQFATQEEDTDEAQGDSRVTQVEIEKVIGFSHSMFKNIVGLNTYSEPFLSMRANDQREIIEQLLGITKLSEKAELLKTLLKNTKDSIKEEEYKIKSVQDSNATIERNIASLQSKSDQWNLKHETDIVNTYEAIEELRKVDIDTEIHNHQLIASAHAQQQKYKEYTKDVSGYQREIKLYQRSIDSLAKQLESTNDSICHTCGSEFHDDAKHKEIEHSIREDIEKNQSKISERQNLLDIAQSKLDSLVAPETDGVVTFYNTLDRAYEHKSSISSLERHLESLAQGENPYLDQIESLRTEGMQKIDYEFLEEIISLRDHQEFLLKLLTNKDSFIRKKIIDQNLNYLNARLDYYLTKIGLPHEVRFISDLSVDISEHGRELDFDNLSRGERTRLILSLSWAFRDVYESLNDRVNLLFIDELMDNGLDTNGVESSLSVLKSIVRETKKSIFLISHREELLGRVDNIVKVVKENGFTAIEQQDD